MNGGGLCHCTLLAGKTSSPVAHRLVEEIWYVVSGEGEVWRKNAEAEHTVRVGGDKPDHSASHRVPVPQHGRQPTLRPHRDDATVAGCPGS